MQNLATPKSATPAATGFQLLIEDVNRTDARPAGSPFFYLLHWTPVKDSVQLGSTQRRRIEINRLKLTKSINTFE